MKVSAEGFDVIAWLDQAGIDYQIEGKNVGAGWIGVNCPFCSDPSYHLGIHLGAKTYNCWRCPAKGTILHLITVMNKCSWAQARTVLARFRDPLYKHLDRRPLSKVEYLRLPPEASKDLLIPHIEWLKSRGFNPQEITTQYDIYGCGLMGEWEWRIIVPVYQNYQMVTYLGRDVTNESPLPYKNLPSESSVTPMKSCLYNLDTVREVALVVEGITDVWRIGDGCVATFGDKWSNEQVRLLKGLKRVFVMFDGEEDALAEAKRMAAALTNVVQHVHVLELSQGDPADLSPSDIEALRLDVFGKR